jgi:hypothetical protein
LVETATVRLEDVLDEREIETVGAARSTATDDSPVYPLPTLLTLT